MTWKSGSVGLAPLAGSTTALAGAVEPCSRDGDLGYEFRWRDST